MNAGRVNGRIRGGTNGRSPSSHPPAIAPDPAASARTVGLRYVHDNQPGIRRVRRGASFRYFDPDGRPVRDAETLRRIRSLVIPPAWGDVWICTRPDGHLQATGRDARGRKQYRYHPRWRAVRDETKYDRMLAFGRALPRLRARVREELDRPGLPREKVLATVVRLLETTLIRVGNEEYVRANGSFGLTTLRDRHVKIDGTTVEFTFRGKSGVLHRVGVHDPRLARVVRRCRDLPGHELFQYLDDQGVTHTIDSADVNDYLRVIAGDEFTAKDFRTWAGTLLAVRALRECPECACQTEAKKDVKAAVAAVAERLGNTPAVCRKCYVHPAVIEAYLDGSLAQALRRRGRREPDGAAPDLSAEEAAVLAFLEKRLPHAAASA